MRTELRLFTAFLAAVSVTWALAASGQARVADTHPAFGCRVPASYTAGAHRRAALGAGPSGRGPVAPHKASAGMGDTGAAGGLALLLVAAGLVTVLGVPAAWPSRVPARAA